MDPHPESVEQRLRKLPKIDALVGRAAEEIPARPRWALTRAAREIVSEARSRILAGDDGIADVGAVIARADALAAPTLRRVLNATGVVLHTNLGRAPLPARALDALEVARGYCNLEYDLQAGRRGSRHGHLVAVLRDVCGAEDACVVNNNAAAVLLALAAIAAHRKAVVSRGELIEIGGSFRIPDVMEISRAQLVEVGTTNKTRIADYRRVIDEDTALLLKVHQANFEIVGFTEEVSVAELAAVGQETGIATMMDLGSGALLPAAEMDQLGLRGEPVVSDVLAAGIDLVTFSCDKLLGGPQAGIVAGRAALVEAVRKHPLMRALRPDKLTIAALAATLELYRSGQRDAIPTLAMLSASVADLEARARSLCEGLGEVGRAHGVDVATCYSTVGGGAKPTARLESRAVKIPTATGRSSERLAARLRAGEVPIIGRIEDDALFLDLRTLAPSDVSLTAELVRAALVGVGDE